MLGMVVISFSLLQRFWGQLDLTRYRRFGFFGFSMFGMVVISMLIVLVPLVDSTTPEGPPHSG